VVFNNHHTGAASKAQIIFRDESRPGDLRYDVGEGIGRAHWSPAYVWGTIQRCPLELVSAARASPKGQLHRFRHPAVQMKRLQLRDDDAVPSTSTPIHLSYPLDDAGMPGLPAGLPGHLKRNKPSCCALKRAGEPVISRASLVTGGL